MSEANPTLTSTIFSRRGTRTLGTTLPDPLPKGNFWVKDWLSVDANNMKSETEWTERESATISAKEKFVGLRRRCPRFSSSEVNQKSCIIR